MKTHLGSQLRAKLRSSAMLCGPWVSIPAPAVVELMAMGDNDFLLIDGEHSSVSAKSLGTLLPCAENHDKPVIYRVPSCSSPEIKFALDAGVSGVMVPMIETAQQAETVVANCRYAPQGQRGIGPWRASGYYRNFADYLAQANQSITLVLQIESRLGVANLDAIAAVEGFDVLYVGPSDLAASHGLPNAELGEEMRAILQRICTAGLAQGKTMGIDVHSVAQIPTLQHMGFSFFTIGSDMEFISNGADGLSRQLSQLSAGGQGT